MTFVDMRMENSDANGGMGKTGEVPTQASRDGLIGMGKEPS
jgi:hypothetical protein